MQIFLSHANEDHFEADLLSRVLSAELGPRVSVWRYGASQSAAESSVAVGIREAVRASVACVFLCSRSTVGGAATQWVELGYADAFQVPVFALLHHVTYDELRTRERRLPPVLTERNCLSTMEWRRTLKEIGQIQCGQG